MIVLTTTWGLPGVEGLGRQMAFDIPQKGFCTSEDVGQPMGPEGSLERCGK